MWEIFYICKHSINKVLPLSVCLPAREVAIKAVVLYVFAYISTLVCLSSLSAGSWIVLPYTDRMVLAGRQEEGEEKKEVE